MKKNRLGFNYSLHGIEHFLLKVLLSFWVLDRNPIIHKTEIEDMSQPYMEKTKI